mgnify:CR=1 FL=1
MCSDGSGRPITPDMTAAQLREAHPEGELALRDLVPAYGGLSSDALRRAVAANSTLQQLAARAGVPLGTLMTEVRRAAGIDDRATGDAIPAWVEPGRVVKRLDARPILASGGHPLEQVTEEVEVVGDGLYELVTPFVPTPLIDLVRSKGFDAFWRWEGETVHTYFRRVR